MRPLRLQIDGFTCFKERQELDLSRLELFAITGPNGAGKSSLLDAMMLCLYGEVPRVGDRYTELISHGRDRMALVFEFRVGERVFRVTRTRRRKGTAQAELEELIDGGERPLADGVREVDRQIQALLGLPYETFTQAVVLPQGEFWKFVKSQPRERREILRELLRHQVYERMRQLAAGRAGTLGEAVRALQKRLDEDYAGATTEALADLRGRAERLAVAVRSAEAERDRRREVLQDVRVRHAKTRELYGCREQVRAFETRGPEMQSMERRLDAARRVAPVIAVVRGAEQAERVAEGQTHQAEVSETELGRAQEAHAAERRRLDAAEAAAKELPDLRNRIRRLDEVRGLVHAREAARTRLAKVEEERRDCTVDLDEAERAEGRARASALQFERKVQETVAGVRKVGYDADLDAGLEAVRDLAATLRALRQRAATLEGSARRASSRAETEETAAASCQADAEAANKQLSDVVRAFEEADHAVRAAEQKSAAALLRYGLQAGEPCPVCGQPVTSPPAPVKLPQLETLKTKRQRASEREQQARQTAEQAAVAAAAARGTAQETRAAAERAVQEVEAVGREIGRQEEQLEVKIGTAVASETGSTIDARVQAAVQRVVGLRQRHQQALRVQQQAEKELDGSRVEIERVVQRAQTLRGRLELVARQIHDADAEVNRLGAEIGKVTQAPDPLAERAELAGRGEQLEEERETARRAQQAAEAKLAAAKAQAEAERIAASEAVRRAQQARQQARQASREAGFEDEAAAEAAALPAADVERLAAEVDRYRRELHAAAQRVVDLSETLAGREATNEDLAAVEAASAEQERLLAEARGEQARLEVEVHNLAGRVDRAAELGRELGERQRDHGMYRRLADDLRSERFQAFVLDESFRELAKGGSARLMNLSGRYTFEYREDSFYVIDHDNAGEQRSADTLSGGETFLASLALALELSEQVQAAAAAVPLDSLFIDEGFGTLDPETLETVAGAIEALPLGGRMVGIITHVAELAARLPSRVVVEKRSDGSRVHVEVN